VTFGCARQFSTLPVRGAPGNRCFYPEKATASLALLITLSKDVTQQKKNISQLKENISQLKENISQLKENISQLKENISQLKENISQLKENISQLKEEHIFLNSGISTYKQILHNLSKRVHPFDINNSNRQTSMLVIPNSS